MSFFSSLGSFFTLIRNFFADPKTIAAETNLVATIEKVDEAIVCFIAAGASVALTAEQAAAAGTGVTNEIYTISNVVCTALKGTPTGATATNVRAVTAVTPAS